MKKSSFYDVQKRPFVRENASRWDVSALEGVVLWPCFATESWYPKGYWLMHEHLEVLALLLVVDGTATLECKDRTYQLVPGSAAIIPYGSRRLVVSPEQEFHKKSIGITGMALKGLSNILRLDEHAVMENFSAQKFNDLFQRISFLLDQKNPEGIAELSALAFSLLLEIASKKELTSYPAPVIKVLHFMEQNLIRKMSIADLCDVAGCSKETLYAIFKKHLRLPPLKYLKQLRLDYAKRLLEDHHTRIKDIARLCGYRNQLYFANDFHHSAGCSPSEYRKKSLQ